MEGFFFLQIDHVWFKNGLDVVTDSDGGEEVRGGWTEGVLEDGGREGGEGRERKPAVLNPEETTGRTRNQWRDR